MSKIMRELRAEALKARAAATPAPAAPPDPNVWPWVYVPTADPEGVCFHGRGMSDPCHECGRP